ncbi:malate dehydrogenase 1B [Paramuricea clavata]|uniref:Malate dehydrogenase, cytoplasmic n=1 Tax=Paramuricea clavata TaxID=317549 RepID=A0A6S7JJY6_PARCT|nr:malate dehydrogenase 1B [Paramuricea clavata]
MAKYVIAGKADCPFFAKAEMLADELQKVLINFKVHKIAVSPENWPGWLKQTCEEHQWKHTTSPLIWREIVDRGGKGLYLGGCDDFMEMAEAYYGIRSTKMSEELGAISKENIATKRVLDEEEIEALKAINPLRITITAAASPVNYIVLNSLLSGEIFGFEQDLSLTLLDTPEHQEALSGVVMEVIDCAWNLLRDISQTSDTTQAFKNADLVLVPDADCSTEDVDILVQNAIVYKQYGELIEADAKKNARILVCGKTANLLASVISAFAPSIPKNNIYALSRLQENRAKAVLARKLKVNSCGITDLIVWGCPGNDGLFDISMSQVKGYDGAIWAPHIETFSRSVVEMIYDHKWVATEFLEEVNKHEESLKEEHKFSPSLSAGVAILDFLKEWWQGLANQMTSLGVISKGWYGVPEGLVFSFPVKFQDDEWHVMDDLDISDDVSYRIKQIGESLKNKTDMVMQILTKS